MFSLLPTMIEEFMRWSWAQIEPFYRDLENRPVEASTAAAWLADWTRLEARVYETYQRLYVAITVNTVDMDAQQRYRTFLDDVYPHTQAAGQRLKEKLLASGLEFPGMEIPLRNMRAEVEIFRSENLPLLAQEMKLSSEYDRIVGAQTVTLDGKEVTLAQLEPEFQSQDRSQRERAWRMAMQRWLDDRQEINELWARFIDLRGQLATNTALPDYRAYRWKQLLRFDYTPQDCARFHAAIEQVAVPAAQRLYEKRRRTLGLDALRPWDLTVDLYGLPPLRPFQNVEDLERGVAIIFQRVDPQLRAYYEVMRREGLLDLGNRKSKAPGGYTTEFTLAHRPFIFANAVGIHDDIQTLLHEGGHAFHVFETAHLPYLQQKEDVPTEFAEVASMTMELLGQPYLAKPTGFYEPADAARANIEHLEGLIRFWPYMAVVDAFQHWVYTHQAEAADPANCDAKWGELWGRFMKGQDWTGLDDAMVTGWHRKLHIFEIPFYYVEYGLAQLGAVQVWRNSLQDERKAIGDYRAALALGNTVALPKLFEASGATLTPDVATLGACVELIESTIARLEQA